MHIIVNYEGPEYLKSFCQRFGIRAFDRVNTVRIGNFELDNVQELERFTELKRFEANKESNTAELRAFFKSSSDFELAG